MYRHTSTTVNKYNDNNHDDAVEVDDESDDYNKVDNKIDEDAYHIACNM